MNQEAEGGGWYKSENVTECHHWKLLQAHEIFPDVLYVIGYFLYLSRKKLTPYQTMNYLLDMS